MSPPAEASSLDRPYREVLLATANSHKLLEVRAILGDLPISPVSYTHLTLPTKA